MPFLTPGNSGSYANVQYVQMWFQAKDCNSQPTSSVPNNYTYTAASGVGTYTETIYDTCLAYFTSSGTPDNQSTLNSLVTQFTTDYMNWRQIYYDFVFTGIAAIAPCGLHDTIEWDYISTKQACKTRVYTYPYNFQIQRLGHADNQNDCTSSSWNALPYLNYYGPPCTSSTITRYKLIFVDGRLVSQYVSTDNT